MTETMRAIRLEGPGEPDALVVSEVPMPEVRPGWVRIRVHAFGVNESEVTSRKGESSPDFSYPRILGIEAVGTVDAVAEGSRFEPGQQVVAMMGGMGREIDGGYAERTVVRESSVVAFASDLPWSTLGALPEMLQTAYGSLRVGLDLQPGQVVLVRGGTSTVGLSAIGIAHDLGASVIATTRDPAREGLLREHGADAVIVANGDIADTIRRSHPRGVDAALELVGLGALPDTMRAVRRGGRVCFTGALDGIWELDRFSPFELIPTGVLLTCYAGEAADLPPDALAELLEAIAAERIRPAIAQVHHGLEAVADAHRGLESGRRPGKHVVVLG